MGDVKTPSKRQNSNTPAKTRMTTPLSSSVSLELMPPPPPPGPTWPPPSCPNWKRYVAPSSPGPYRGLICPQPTTKCIKRPLFPQPTRRSAGASYDLPSPWAVETDRTMCSGSLPTVPAASPISINPSFSSHGQPAKFLSSPTCTHHNNGEKHTQCVLTSSLP